MSAFIVLGILLVGILNGVRRPAGTTTSHYGLARSPLFYLLSTALFLALSFAFWKPLPLTLTPSIRSLALIAGMLFYFPGLAFLLWGRLTLGKMYFVSIISGEQLFANHQLVKLGPYAIVRHPMYLGLITAAGDSLPLYQTWTTVIFVFLAPFVLLRALSVEQVLSIELAKSGGNIVGVSPTAFPLVEKARMIHNNRHSARILAVM